MLTWKDLLLLWDCVWRDSVVGEGAAGWGLGAISVAGKVCAPFKKLRERSPGSKLTLPLAQAEQMSASAIKYLAGGAR